MDRFVSNAQKGRDAMSHSAEKVWRVFGEHGSGKMDEPSDLEEAKVE